MKNLKEIWSGIRLDAELIKQNYNAELLGIGVHGMTRLAVKLEDADLEFIQGSLKELYVSENDKDYTVRSFVRITEKNGAGAQLLLKSLVLGFENMESNYEEYIDLTFEEV